MKVRLGTLKRKMRSVSRRMMQGWLFNVRPEDRIFIEELRARLKLNSMRGYIVSSNLFLMRVIDF